MKGRSQCQSADRSLSPLEPQIYLQVPLLATSSLLRAKVAGPRSWHHLKMSNVLVAMIGEHVYRVATLAVGRPVPKTARKAYREGIPRLHAGAPPSFAPDLLWSSGSFVKPKVTLAKCLANKLGPGKEFRACPLQSVPQNVAHSGGQEGDGKDQHYARSAQTMDVMKAEN